MAITAREQEILNRSDRGVSIAAIAAELSLSRGYVGRVVRALTVDTGEPRRQRTMIASGSTALLKAIRLARGEC